MKKITLFTFNLIKFDNKKTILKIYKGKRTISLKYAIKKDKDCVEVESFYAYSIEETKELEQYLSVYK